jgi:hypothetical protein
MDEKYLLPFIAKFEESLLLLHKKWNNKEDESGPFVAELKEAYDFKEFPTDVHKWSMPQVLAYRAPVTLSEVQRRLPQAKKEHDLTVLSTFTQTHILETVKALRTLVGQFKWHSLVEQRFSGRISRAEAQEMTIAQAIEGEPKSEQPIWNNAFDRLDSAWHDSFQYVDRFECLEIPAHMKTFTITKASTMNCAIVDEKDLGICPLVLTQWLVARHNDLVQAAALCGGYPIRKQTSTTMGHHDEIFYDKEQMMSFIKDRCVTHGAGGKLKLDLVELERHLRHEFAKPELSFHLRLFQWLGETSSGSNSLRDLIAQTALESEVQARLKSEIRTPVQAAAILQKLQMAATFIVNSRDVLDAATLGTMKLCDYLTQVLAEPTDSLQSATAQAEVQLRHVDDFVRVLNGVIHADPMDGLPEKFRQELTPELEGKLADLATNLADHLDPILRAMEGLVTYLSEGGQNEDTAMVEWIPPCLEYMFGQAESAEAATANFPKEMKLSHFERVYVGLKNRREAGPAAGSS